VEPHEYDEILRHLVRIAAHQDTINERLTASIERLDASIERIDRTLAHVEITQGPSLEFAREDLAIIRWTTNNPGGSDEHFGVVHYGTDPGNLSLTVKSHLRLNRGHPETIFRVRLDGLKPQITYYYVVTAIESSGKSDEFRSPVNQFTTPAPGKRIAAYPEPK